VESFSNWLLNLFDRIQWSLISLSSVHEKIQDSNLKSAIFPGGLLQGEEGGGGPILGLVGTHSYWIGTYFK
jgi:hypothetical protein